MYVCLQPTHTCMQCTWAHTYMHAHTHAHTHTRTHTLLTYTHIHDLESTYNTDNGLTLLNENARKWMEGRLPDTVVQTPDVPLCTCRGRVAELVNALRKVVVSSSFQPALVSSYLGHYPFTHIQLGLIGRNSMAVMLPRSLDILLVD